MSPVAVSGPQNGKIAEAQRAPLEQSRTELLIALAVFLTTCLYLSPLRDYVSFNADEGLSLVAAERVLRGQVPYRDFDSLLTPGTPYLLAAIFRIFGNSLLTARTLLLAFSGCFATITYLLGRKLYDRRTALFATGLLTFGCMPLRFFVLHNWDSTFLAVLTLYSAQRTLESTSNKFWCTLTGLLAALTFLTEQPKGAGLILGLCMGMAALIVTDRDPRRWPWSTLPFLVLSFATPFVFTFAYFAAKHSLWTMLDSWIWPMRHYSAVNRLPFGYLPITGSGLRAIYSGQSISGHILVTFFGAPLVLVSALALLVIAATIYSIIHRFMSGGSPRTDAQVLGGCVFAGVLLATLSTGRADLNHLLYLTPLFMYLVPSVIDVEDPKVATLYAVRPVVACVLLASFIGFGFVTVMKALQPSLRTVTRRGVIRTAYSDQALNYIQANVAEGQHMYVHPYQPFYSYMTGTMNPTRFDFLFPGMNTREQSLSVVHDLEADATSTVLLDPTFYSDKVPETWPSTPAEALATDPVADYILKHYRTCRHLNAQPRRTWSFYFMARNDIACPAGPVSAQHQH